MRGCLCADTHPVGRDGKLSMIPTRPPVIGWVGEPVVATVSRDATRIAAPPCAGRRPSAGPSLEAIKGRAATSKR